MTTPDILISAALVCAFVSAVVHALGSDGVYEDRPRLDSVMWAVFSGTSVTALMSFAAAILFGLLGLS